MTEKEIAIREVIEKRVKIIRKIVKKCDNPETKSWYEGRIVGLMDVHDLLSDSLECIKVEL